MSEPWLLEEDALLIASAAAKSIVERAGRGGTDAITYESARDAVMEALSFYVRDGESSKTAKAGNPDCDLDCTADPCWHQRQADMRTPAPPWTDADLVEHFCEIRVEDPANGSPVVDNIGLDWINDHFDRLALLIRRGAQVSPQPVEAAQIVEAANKLSYAIDYTLSGAWVFEESGSREMCEVRDTLYEIAAARAKETTDAGK